MPATVQFQTQLTYQQVAQLVGQLPAEDKQKLAKLLETEVAATWVDEATMPIGETRLTPAQRKIVANVRQGFREMKLVKEGKLKAEPIETLLNELREEGL